MTVQIKILLQKIESKFGRPILYSQQCEALSQAILDNTGELVSESTLKRIFEFSSKRVVPRGATLDILARYIDYPDWSSFTDELNGSPTISEFAPVEGIDVRKLNINQLVRISYQPDRQLLLKYIGDSKFKVLEAVNSKLNDGDIVSIAFLHIGFRIVVREVLRNGENLGGYVAAKDDGISTLEILN